VSMIAVGDKVAYSVQFLRSVGMRQSNLARARGTVTEVKTFSSSALARIDWDDQNIPERVNVANLSLVGANRKFCEC
jgi:hypothetical protein